ncbi:MAG: hypothetical protein ACT4PZ_01820 [Panacagrimonas sp.]
MATLTDMQKLMRMAATDRAVVTVLQNLPVGADGTATVKGFKLTRDQVAAVKLDAFQAEIGQVHDQLDLWVLGATVAAASCQYGYRPKGKTPSFALTTDWQVGNDVGRALEIALNGDTGTKEGVKAVLTGLQAEMPGGSEQHRVLGEIITQVA